MTPTITRETQEGTTQAVADWRGPAEITFETAPPLETAQLLLQVVDGEGADELAAALDAWILANSPRRP